METRIELEKEEFIPFIIDEKIKQIWNNMKKIKVPRIEDDVGKVALNPYSKNVKSDTLKSLLVDTQLKINDLEAEKINMEIIKYGGIALQERYCRLMCGGV
jgi:hypothetical protein